MTIDGITYDVTENVWGVDGNGACHLVTNSTMGIEVERGSSIAEAVRKHRATFGDRDLAFSTGHETYTVISRSFDAATRIDSWPI